MKQQNEMEFINRMLEEATSLYKTLLLNVPHSERKTRLVKRAEARIRRFRIRQQQVVLSEHIHWAGIYAQQDPNYNNF